MIAKLSGLGENTALSNSIEMVEHAQLSKSPIQAIPNHLLLSGYFLLSCHNYPLH